jgi:ketosteroid isomerase-like protein
MNRENIAALVGELDDCFAAAFDRRDAPALVALFTKDVTIILEWGNVVAGSDSSLKV